jgi:hypothetical protein
VHAQLRYLGAEIEVFGLNAYGHFELCGLSRP